MTTSIATSECDGEVRPSPTAVLHDMIGEAFEHASAACPTQVIEACYQFAGRIVQVLIVGRELAASIDGPFAHLRVRRVRALSPDLRVEIWDESATGVRCPRSGGQLDSSVPVAIDASPEGRFVAFQRAATCLSFDRSERCIRGWASGVDHLTQLDRGRPFRDPLLIWHQDRGVETVHAALVARDSRGVLLGGRGGVGKTTTALACLHAGFTYLSDDYVGLESVGASRFVGHSLYGSAHLAPGQLQHFPRLEAQAVRPVLPSDDKSLIVLSDVFPDRLASTVDIRVLALPRITEARETRYRSASKSEALLSLAPSSLLMQPASAKRKRGFDKLVELIEHTPTYWLELGSDVAAVPSSIDMLLDEVAR